MIVPKYLASDTAGMTVVFRWIEVAHGIDWLGLEMTRSCVFSGFSSRERSHRYLFKFPRSEDRVSHNVSIDSEDA